MSLCWGACLAAAMGLHLRFRKTLLPLKGFFGNPPSLAKWEKLLLVLMAGTVAFVVFKIFLSPPNAPTDSMVYHQPRAFMYYKNQSVHAFATSYGHMLYFGPLNALWMSQLQILSFGWDGLYPMAQFSAYLLTMLAVYQTALLLCKDRRFGLLGAAMVCFMPMAHLQASTTQADLLVTCFCALAAYYMTQIWRGLPGGEQPPEKPGQGLLWYLFGLLGLSCGLAVLSKLNAGVTLLCFALLFAAALLAKLRKAALPRLGAIVLCTLVVTGGFWTRNALDWNGDFLPLSYAGARPQYQDIGVKGTLLISAKALATTFASPHRDLPGVLALPSYWTARAAAALLGVDVDRPGTNEDLYGQFTGTVHFMPNDISYPLHAVAVAAALLFFLVRAVRKKDGWLLAYTLACTAGVWITSTQYVWVTSFKRYLCPPLCCAFPWRRP